MTLPVDAQAVSKNITTADEIIKRFILIHFLLSNLQKIFVILRTEILTKIVPNF
jgi:hypothetical protein